jgi:Protein of unknown function (DUF2914)
VNGVRVLEARLCRVLTTDVTPWRCTPAANPTGSARLTFLTRIDVPRAMRVHHRWFRGDSLQQDVTLSVRVSPGTGYRTFSRQTVGGPSGTVWRVEVRTTGGQLLREERIVMR